MYEMPHALVYHIVDLVRDGVLDQHVLMGDTPEFAIGVYAFATAVSESDISDADPEVLVNECMAILRWKL